jgi:YggT family protein
MAIDLVLSVIEYAILARVLISFLPISRDNQLIRLLYQITEPILAPLRNLLEKSPIGGNSMFDFSPLIAFLIIGLIRNLL